MALAAPKMDKVQDDREGQDSVVTGSPLPHPSVTTFADGEAVVVLPQSVIDALHKSRHNLVLKQKNSWQSAYCAHCDEVLGGVALSKTVAECSLCTLTFHHQKCPHQLPDVCPVALEENKVIDVLGRQQIVGLIRAGYLQPRILEMYTDLYKRVAIPERRHDFITHSYKHTTVCTCCKKPLVKNLAKVGLQCRVCQYNIHKQCLTKIHQHCPGPVWTHGSLVAGNVERRASSGVNEGQTGAEGDGGHRHSLPFLSTRKNPYMNEQLAKSMQQEKRHTGIVTEESVGMDTPSHQDLFTHPPTPPSLIFTLTDSTERREHMQELPREPQPVDPPPLESLFEASPPETLPGIFLLPESNEWEVELRCLADMGFGLSMREAVELLAQFDGDVRVVVQELLKRRPDYVPHSLIKQQTTQGSFTSPAATTVNGSKPGLNHDSGRPGMEHWQELTLEAKWVREMGQLEDMGMLRDKDYACALLEVYGGNVERVVAHMLRDGRRRT